MAHDAQFAIVWKRQGLRVKRRVFARRATAERWLVLLGPEPWLAFKKKPDAKECCDGYMCGCSGLTVREAALATRADYPPLEFARIETRDVSPWTIADPEPSSPEKASVEGPK